MIKMAKLLGITAAALVASAGFAQTTTICQWNFNVPGAELVPITGTVVPSIGSGTLQYIGSFATAPNGDPILPMFRSGGGSGDTTAFPDNAGLDQSPFPAQGTGDRTSGLEVAVSTVGRSNIVVTFDQRHSNRAAKHVQFEYSVDGVNFTSAGLTDQPAIGANGLFTATAGDVWFNARTIDLSSIPAVNNNPNFKWRVVAAFAPATSVYQTSGGATWDSNGRYRYDAVTVKSVNTSVNINVDAKAQPHAAITGGSGSALFVAEVVPGVAPISTGMTVTADFSPIGGGSSVALNDSGLNGDLGAGDGRWSFNYTVPASVGAGTYHITVTATDLQGRVDTANARLEVAVPTPSTAPVVISQLFSSGGAFGAAYNADYCELFNRSTSPVDIGGWSIQGASDDLPFSSDKLITIPGGTVLPAGGYYLVQLTATAGGQYGLPLIADLIGTPGFGIGQPDGKVALARTSDVVTSCPTPGTDLNLADLVGYGGSTDCYFGAGTSLDTTVLTATTRKGAGCQDTRQNFHDFQLLTPNPRASFSSLNVCTPVCTADFNADGTVDFFDYLDFVDAFSAGAIAADFNADAVIDFFDYLDFVDAFSSGC